MTTLAIILGIWLAGNLLHLAWITVRHRSWERDAVRNPSGLLEHAEPFSCGEGATALVFIHGFADLPHGWVRIAERLRETHGFACHAIRLPRWGEPLAAQRTVTLDQMRGAIDAKIDELTPSHASIWLVGHSMGFALALDALPRNGDKIHGLVALAPLIRVSDKRVPFLTARFWYNLGTRALWLTRTFESPFTTRVCAADDPAFSYAVDKFIPYTVYDTLFAVTRSNRSVALPPRMPVFCALSQSDRVIDNRHARAWFESLSGPKELYIDTESAHALHVGANWREITDRFGEFISRSPDHPACRLRTAL